MTNRSRYQPDDIVNPDLNNKMIFEMLKVLLETEHIHKILRWVHNITDEFRRVSFYLVCDHFYLVGRRPF